MVEQRSRADAWLGGKPLTLRDRAAVERDRVGGVVLRVLRDADRVRHRDELLDEGQDVLGGQDAAVLGHGDAEPQGTRKDFDRKLNDRGEHQAAAAGGALAALGIEFELVLTSPRVRARDTARIACDALGVAPAEHTARPWAFWINVIALIIATVFLMAKAPFVLIALAFGIDLAFLVYIYVGWLPPLEAAWIRERRRAKYLPKPKRRRR